MMNECAMLNFSMASMMMAFSTLVFCKAGNKTCAESALLSLVGIGVGFVALICVYPGFQTMVQSLPIISNLINNNSIIALIVNCLVFAGTATLAVIALSGPCKLKASKPMDLYKCFALGIALTFAVVYIIDSGCIVKHSHSTKTEKNSG